MWYNTFDSIFFITSLTIITGSFGLCLKYSLKSKCDEVACCFGLITIHRNVELETIDIENNNNIEENKI